MDTKTEIRKATISDLAGIKEVLDSSELFPSEFLDGMIAPYLADPDSEERWFIAVSEAGAIGFGYCVPEKLTDRTYNLLAVALKKDWQGKGLGAQLIAYIEHQLKTENKRLLIIETSSDPQYLATRKFYRKLGYRPEASIPDFWKEGEDKIIFWKKLNGQ